jgi:hypothetical protein
MPTLYGRSFFTAPKYARYLPTQCSDIAFSILAKKENSALRKDDGITCHDALIAGKTPEEINTSSYPANQDLAGLTTST